MCQDISPSLLCLGGTSLPVITVWGPRPLAPRSLFPDSSTPSALGSGNMIFLPGKVTRWLLLNAGCVAS